MFSRIQQQQEVLRSRYAVPQSSGEPLPSSVVSLPEPETASGPSSSPPPVLYSTSSSPTASAGAKPAEKTFFDRVAEALKALLPYGTFTETSPLQIFGSIFLDGVDVKRYEQMQKKIDSEKHLFQALEEAGLGVIFSNPEATLTSAQLGLLRQVLLTEKRQANAGLGSQLVQCLYGDIQNKTQLKVEVLQEAIKIHFNVELRTLSTPTESTPTSRHHSTTRSSSPSRHEYSSLPVQDSLTYETFKREHGFRALFTGRDGFEDWKQLHLGAQEAHKRLVALRLDGTLGRKSPSSTAAAATTHAASSASSSAVVATAQTTSSVSSQISLDALDPLIDQLEYDDDLLDTLVDNVLEENAFPEEEANAKRIIELLNKFAHKVELLQYRTHDRVRKDKLSLQESCLRLKALNLASQYGIYDKETKNPADIKAKIGSIKGLISHLENKYRTTNPIPDKIKSYLKKAAELSEKNTTSSKTRLQDTLEEAFAVTDQALADNDFNTANFTLLAIEQTLEANLENPDYINSKEAIDHVNELITLLDSFSNLPENLYKGNITRSQLPTFRKQLEIISLHRKTIENYVLKIQVNLTETTSKQKIGDIRSIILQQIEFREKAYYARLDIADQLFNCNDQQTTVKIIGEKIFSQLIKLIDLWSTQIKNNSQKIKQKKSELKKLERESAQLTQKLKAAKKESERQTLGVAISSLNEQIKIKNFELQTLRKNETSYRNKITEFRRLLALAEIVLKAENIVYDPENDDLPPDLHKATLKTLIESLSITPHLNRFKIETAIILVSLQSDDYDDEAKVAAVKAAIDFIGTLQDPTQIELAQRLAQHLHDLLPDQEDGTPLSLLTKIKQAIADFLTNLLGLDLDQAAQQTAIQNLPVTINGIINQHQEEARRQAEAAAAQPHVDAAAHPDVPHVDAQHPDDHAPAHPDDDAPEGHAVDPAHPPVVHQNPPAEQHDDDANAGDEPRV